MKKSSNIFLILLFLFSVAFADESYQLNTFFPIEKPKTPNNVIKEEPITKEKPSKKPPKQKNKKFNYLTNKEEEIPRGYYGTLPDIEADFQYMKQQTKTSSNINMQIPKENDEIDENDFQEAPFDDTLFLDKIAKKEPNSLYVNDLIKIKVSIENLQKCLEEKGNIQRFNASVNMIDLLCQSFQKKYENSSNSLKESYNDILALNYFAKTLGNLKYNASYYSRYVPTCEGQYSKENIEKEEEKLLSKVNKTLFSVIKEMD